MHKALIIDDEENARQVLADMVNAHCPDITLAGEANSVETAFKQITHHQPDLVFLDVEMPGANGFELLRMFDEIPFEVIFTTAYGHYAIEAIKFSALDYLLKPIEAPMLIEAVKKLTSRSVPHPIHNQGIYNLLNNLHQGNRLRLGIPDLEGITYIYLDDLIYCASDGNYTQLQLQNDRQLVSSKPIGYYEQLLQEHRFFRVHKSYLINLKHVLRYKRGTGGTAIMRDGSEIDVSKRRKDDFLAQMNMA
ncbi:MAG: LytTR family DNA-binding domain-containing protein [Bacteroidota bacterium]